MKELIKNTINRSLSDSRNAIIDAEAIKAVVGLSNIQEASKTLCEWEMEGQLEVIAPLTIELVGPCVRMKRFIGRRSPIPGFLNWEE